MFDNTLGLGQAVGIGLMIHCKSEILRGLVGNNFFY